MERLQRELDGHCRTSSGFCAVVPRVSSGITPEKNKYFEFKTSPMSDVTRIEWPAASPVALFDNDVAIALVRSKYAFDLNDAQLSEYNSLVDGAPKEVATPKQPDAPTEFPPAGWIPHPDAAGFFYKGNEVLSEADLRAKVAAT